MKQDARKEALTELGCKSNTLNRRRRMFLGGALITLILWPKLLDQFFVSTSFPHSRSSPFFQDWRGWPCSIQINCLSAYWPHPHLKQYRSKQWEFVLPQEMGIGSAGPDCLGGREGVWMESRNLYYWNLDMQESSPGIPWPTCLSQEIYLNASVTMKRLGTSTNRFTKPRRTLVIAGVHINRSKCFDISGSLFVCCQLIL